jgi:hypothetical protein
MHSTILITIGVGFFAPAMFVLYLAFIPPETVRRLPTTIKQAGAQSLLHLRRHSTGTNDQHDAMPEDQEDDNDSSTAAPTPTPSDWIRRHRVGDLTHPDHTRQGQHAGAESAASQ